MPAPLRVLIVCVHNSAPSRMAEALTRKAARITGDAKAVTAAVGLSLSAHTSKTMYDVPDLWNFDYVLTVCGSAAEACALYLGGTVRRHHPFVDPSGGGLERWRAMRDQPQQQFSQVVEVLKGGQDVPPRYAASPAVTAQ